MKKPLLATGAGLAVLGLAWAGTGFYVGTKAQQALLDLSSPKDKPTSPWKIEGLRHERGLFKSSGQLTALYSENCAQADGSDEPLRLAVSYTIEHLPLPQSPARFSWNLTPQGEAADVFKTLFGSVSALSGQGTISYSGAVRSGLQLPAVALRRNGEVIEATPTSGTLEIKDKTLRFDSTVEKVSVRGKGRALVVQGLSVGLDLDDLRKGTGSGQFKVERASASGGSLEGLEFKMDAREKGDRMNLDFSPSVRKIEAAGQMFTDLRMQWAVHGLHTASVESLIKLVDESCGMEDMTAQDRKMAAQALQTLLVKGLSVGMPVLAGKAAEGRIEGSFKVELQPAQGDTPSLVQQLRSSGKLEVEGQVVSPQQQEMAVVAGFAVREGNKLSTRYEYARGLFKVNDRAMDASAFEVMLTRIDTKMREALSLMRQP